MMNVTGGLEGSVSLIPAFTQVQPPAVSQKPHDSPILLCNMSQVYTVNMKTIIHIY